MIIRNKETGQLLQVDDPSLATKYGIELPQEEAPKKNLAQKAVDIGKGMFVDPFLQYGQTQTTKSPGAGLGIKTPVGPVGLANPVPSNLDEALNSLEVAGLLTSGMNPISVVKGLWDSPKYLYKGGLVKLLNNAYKTATEGGVKISKSDILNQAKNATKLENKKIDIEKFIENIFQKPQTQNIRKDYFKVVEKNQFNPSELWDINRDISKSYGPSIFDWFTGTSADKQAAQATRNAISTLLKENVPQSKLPNWLYSKYSGKLGSPGNIALKYALPIGANSLLGNPVGGAISNAVRSVLPANLSFGSQGGY